MQGLNLMLDAGQTRHDLGVYRSSGSADDIDGARYHHQLDISHNSAVERSQEGSAVCNRWCRVRPQCRSMPRKKVEIRVTLQRRDASD